MKTKIMLRNGLIPFPVITLALLLAGLVSQAQLTQEKVYNYSLTSTRINQTDYKFFLMDVAGSQCRIYNPDHTLWKNIPISLPTNYFLYDIKYVTQYLFNSDAQVELWYSAYEWVSTGASAGYYRYISKVVNEQGTVLANVNGGAYAYVIQAGSESYKLAVYAYDNSTTPYSVQTYIFALPNGATAADYVSLTITDPYPNPADDIINLPVTSGSGNGILQVFSLSGEKLHEASIRGENVYRLNTGNWPSGIYSYRVINEGVSSEVKKFIVQ